MRIRPLGDKVVVKDETPSKKTVGGVLLPTRAQSTLKATVIAVGPGKVFKTGHRHEMNLKSGDKVLVAKGGLPVDLKGCMVRIVDIQDIIAVAR